LNNHSLFFAKRIDLGLCHAQYNPSNISMKLFYRMDEEKQEFIRYWIYVQKVNLELGQEVFKY